MTTAIARHKPQSNENQIFIRPNAQLDILISPVTKAVSDASSLIGNLSNLVAQYAADGADTNWYKAISYLELPIKQVPLLPTNIAGILESDCPIYGAPFKIQDTFILSLIHKDFKNGTELEEQILQPYAEKIGQKEHPFKLKFGMNYRKHLSTSYDETYFLLITKDVIPNSRQKNWDEQVSDLKKLRENTGVNFRISTFSEAYASIITHKIVTGESLYNDNVQLDVAKAVSDASGLVGNTSNLVAQYAADATDPTWTRVSDKIQDRYMALGGQNALGLSLN